jgi:hypothetical protein
VPRPGAALENGTPAKQESGSWKNLYGRLALTLAVLVGTGVSAGAKYNRPARRPVATGNSVDPGPTQDARRHQIPIFFAIIFENPYNRIYADQKA